MSGQVNELNIIRQSLYELEAQHTKIRKQYEEELARTRAELHALRQNLPHASSSHPPLSAGAPLAMAALSGPGPLGAMLRNGPPFGADPFFSRREPTTRDAQEREMLERERAERERDRLMDQRDPKRLKADRMGKSDRASGMRFTVHHNGNANLFLYHLIDIYSPSLGNMPKLPPPGATSATMTGPGMPSKPIPHLPPPPPAPMSIDPAAAGQLMPPNTAGSGSFLDEIDLHNVPPELKKEGSDWFAIFNPKVKRVLDVNLVHTLMHERSV